MIHPRVPLKLTLLPVLASLALPSLALACGGFFCDGSNPIVQSGERILFEVDPVEEEVTAVVELQYQGLPMNFGWVLPVPASVDVTDIGTAAPGLFDELELATAPVFFELGVVQESMPSSGGFGCFGGPWGSGRTSGGSTSEDEVITDSWTDGTVLGTANVGPYAIELVTSSSGELLEEWLSDNGYLPPDGLAEAAQPYVAAGMNFVAIQISPDRFEGVIEAVTYTWSGVTPMIPLVLTSVAAVEDMEIIAYVLAEEQYRPAGYATAELDWESVEFVSGGTDYTERLREVVDSLGGRAFITELAGPTADELDDVGEDTREWLERRPYITRMRTFISPADMSSDPSFVPAPELEDVDNVHRLVEVTFGMAALLLLVVPLAARRRAG